MSKEKRILSYFLGWLLVGYIIFVIGSNNVFAATTTTYENIGYLNDVTILYSLSDDPPYPLEIPRGGEYQLYNVEKIMVQIDNYTFSGGTTYNLELSLPISTLTNNIYSVIDENGNKCSIGTTDSSNSSYPNYSFNCSKNTNSLTLNIYNTDGSDVLDAGIFRWNYIYLRKQLTTTDTSILENQTSQIIDQNQQIIQGQDNIKDAIIDSNKETQDVIKDQFNDCHDSINLFKVPNNQTVNGITLTNNSDGTFNLNGTATEDVNFSIYVPIDESGIVNNEIYTLSKESNYNFRVQAAFYNGNTWVRTPLNLAPGSPLYISNTIILTNVTQVRFIITIVKETFINLSNVKIQLEKGSNVTSWEPYGEEICSNKIDETNDKLSGIQGALTDSSTPNLSGLEDSIGWLPPGPVDSILNLPLTMLNSLTNSLTKTCAPLNLNLPYVNKNIQIPCLSAIFAQITGVNGLWTWVGTIASVLILYNYLLNLYAWVDRVLTLRAEFDEAMGADLANWGRL